MGIHPRFVQIVLAFISATVCQAQFSPEERSAIESALFVGNVVRSDLKWDRRPFSDPFRFAAVDASLDEPIEEADRWWGTSARLLQLSAGNAISLLSSNFPRKSALDGEPRLPEAGKWNGPAVLREPVTQLVRQIAVASEEVRAATTDLTPEERRQIIESLPSFVGEESTPTIDFVSQRPQARARLLELVQRVDISRIVTAAASLSAAVDEAAAKIKTLKVDLQKQHEQRLYGRIVRIAGKGDDVHEDTDSSLLIDLGGSDRYRGRHGAGVGYAAVLLDLEGDDIYEPKDLSIGAGILGIGIARDEIGHDVYKGRSLSFGCGLAGVGLLVDAGGDDRYQATAMSQGFATFGIGLLLDAAGSDLYDVGIYGQGASRTQGIGVLIDRTGRDIYRAGGLTIHSPLFADVHYSFSQGFSMGFREDSGGVSGGIAALIDGGGDDSYLAETFAQGASYWFGLGMLFDGSGHDTYSAYHYAQASAMHMTSAYLFDNAGDDAYSLKFGAGHAIGHDYGVAVLVDRVGNDVYAARDSNPAVGNANGFALFLDAAGDDRYAGPPGRGNAARGSGSFGVFVDVAGQDKYREGLADASTVVSDSWGVAVDFETARQIAGTAPNRTDTPEPGSLAKPSDREFAEIYQKASQWGVGTAQEEVELNVQRLIGIGQPAVEWMLTNRLGRADRLQIRTFTAVISAVGAPARIALAGKIATGNLDEKRNGLSIAVETRSVEASPLVPGLIDQPALRLQAVRAAGALASKESVPKLIPITREQGNIGLAAMIALGQITDESAAPTAEALLRDSNLPMRKAAIQCLAKFPSKAKEAANRLLLDREERVVRIGIELLGAVGTPEALDAIAQRLLDPSPGVRIQSLLVLNGKCPEEHRTTFAMLRNDPDPAVRGVAARVDPGR